MPYSQGLCHQGVCGHVDSQGMRVAWTVNRPVEMQLTREVLGVQVLTDTMKK